MLTFVLGGARSGKSAFAEKLASEAERSGKSIVYIATGWAGDAEMDARIVRHRAQRPATWQTIEEPIALAQTIREHARSDRLILIDCLTLWLSNLMLTGPQAPGLDELAAERARLCQSLASCAGDIVLVSNEVGMGLVSEHALGRRFVDESGWLHQQIVAIADRAYFIVAGRPLTLKP